MSQHEMESSAVQAPSSFTDVSTSINEYDTVAQIELSFGSIVSMMDEGDPLDSNEHEVIRTRGVSIAQRYERSPSDIDEDDDEEMPTSSHDAGGEDVASDEDSEQDASSDFQPLTYARQYGLTTCYFDEDPLENAWIPTPPESVLEDLNPGLRAGGVAGAKKLLEQPANERWEIDKETAQFLTAVMALSRTDDMDDIADNSHQRSMRDLKMEETVLPSDPDIDLAKLKARHAVRLSIGGMIPYNLDEDSGEALIWSAEDLKLPSVVNNAIASEKLDVDKEAIELLREFMGPSTLDRWETLEQAIQADMCQKLRREAIPLLPRSPSLSPFVVSHEAYEMELTSSPDDLFALEAAKIEGELLGIDDAPQQITTTSRTFAGQDTSDDIRDPTKTPVTSSSSPLRQKRLRDLKADSPVLLQDPSSSPAKRAKTVSFPEELHTMIPAPDTDDSIMDPDHAHRDADTFVTEVVAPIAKLVVDQAGNENLDELDTTLRVRVPAVEDVKAVAPWEDEGDILSRFAQEIPQDRKKWSGISKLEQLVSWTPFPRYLGKVALDEQFDDGSCERYLAEFTMDDGRTDIEPLLWKRDGLRLLDHYDSDEDELERGSIKDGLEEDVVDGESAEPLLPAVKAPVPKPIVVPTPKHAPAPVQHANENDQQPFKQPDQALTGMQALLQRRKLELEATGKPKPATIRALGDRSANNAHNQSSGNTSFNFAGGGLRSFLGLQGAKILDTAMPIVQPQERPSMVQPSVKPDLSLAVREDVRPPRRLPAPLLDAPTHALWIVVSSSMLAKWQLVRDLQAQLPTLELIERDPTSVAPSADRSSTTQEADFTLSPSTGLICTTLQKLKQKPLPGQHNFFGIRERIAAVSPRYECCIVIVGEGAKDDRSSIASLDPRDTAAISELTGFVNSLDSDIKVFYVPGGDTELARWIAASVCRYASADEAAKLLHDETMWERVLRNAGANSAAAQLILAKLKRLELAGSSGGPPEYRSPDGSPYGLHAFVQMSVQERIQRFGPMMGGDSVLRSMSEAIDGGWISASTR